MRDFGVIHTRFWPWAQEQGLGDIEKMVAVYALSCEHSNSLGCFRLPQAYVAEDLGYPIDTVSIAYSKLMKKGLLGYCEETKYVILHKYLKWNPPQNHKHAQGMLKIARQIPKNCQISEDVIHSLIMYGGKYIRYTVCDTLYYTLCHRVSIPYTIPYGYTDPDPDPDQDPERGGDKKSPTPAKRACQFPSDFELDKIKTDYALKKGIPSDLVKSVFDHFKNHHTAKGSRMKDWSAAWRTWCCNEKNFNGGRNGRTAGGRTAFERSRDSGLNQARLMEKIWNEEDGTDLSNSGQGTRQIEPGDANSGRG